jgi:hypothetical protein
MKSYKIFAVLLAAAAALAISASPARAQAAEAAAAAEVVEPIISKVVSVVTPKKNPRGGWLKAEVVRADANTIIVRERDNERMIHTFTYGPELKDKMQAMVDKGGYQYGDKVNILVSPENTVALRIHGKPSKSL